MTSARRQCLLSLCAAGVAARADAAEATVASGDDCCAKTGSTRTEKGLNPCGSDLPAQRRGTTRGGVHIKEARGTAIPGTG